jgi:hypothetical protein
MNDSGLGKNFQPMRQGEGVARVFPAPWSVCQPGKDIFKSIFNLKVNFVQFFCRPGIEVPFIGYRWSIPIGPGRPHSPLVDAKKVHSFEIVISVDPHMDAGMMKCFRQHRGARTMHPDYNDRPFKIFKNQ